MSKYIPLSIPNFEGNEKQYVDDAIDQRWVSTGGPYVIRFEKDIAKYLNTDNVAVCQSGTSGIHLALIDAGIKSGDVVLVSPLTFIAAVNPIKYQHATPVFIDCDDSLCLDPIKLNHFCETKCEWDGEHLKYNDKPVKAVIVVHVFGNMADMENIMPVSEKYNLIVIEDSTEALGTKYINGKYKDKYAGTIGDYGAFSFNGNKIITTGGGGAVTARNSNSVDHIRFLSTQAKTDPHYYIHDEVGYNYRMTNLQAALGVAQMEELPEFIRRKQKNYEIYKELFEGFNYCKLLPFRKGTESNKWFYSLQINRQLCNLSMHDIISSLHNRGIETRAVWGLINEQKPYKDEATYMLEKAPFYSSCILNIPSSTQIREDDIQYVVSEVKQLLMGQANG